MNQKEVAKRYFPFLLQQKCCEYGYIRIYRNRTFLKKSSKYVFKPRIYMGSDIIP